MTRTLTFLLALLWVSFLFAHLAPRFIDADFLASSIEARLSDATGHRVSVGQKVAFQLLPRPAFQVTDVDVFHGTSTIGQISDGEDILLSANAVTMYAHPWALLFGQFQAQKLELIAPTITVTRDPGGETAWNNAPIVAALTDPWALIREQSNAAPSHRGMSARIDLVGATLELYDTKTEQVEQWYFPQMTFTPDQQGTQLGFEGEIRLGDWDLAAQGSVSLSRAQNGEAKRPFSIEVRGENANRQIGFDRLALEGFLSDSFLTTLRINPSDQWRASLKGYRHPGLTRLAGDAFMSLDLDTASISGNIDDLALGAVQMSLIGGGAAPLAIEVEGEIGYKAAQTAAQSGPSLSLRLSANNQRVPQSLLPKLLDTPQAAIEAIAASLAGVVVEFDLSLTDIAATGDTQPHQPVSGRVQGTMSGAGLELGPVSISGNQALSLELIALKAPVNGTAAASGGFSAVVSENRWIGIIAPELMALAPTAERLDYTGAVTLDLSAGRVVSHQNARVLFDQVVSMGLQQTRDAGGGKVVKISASDLDLLWLQGPTVAAQLGGIETAQSLGRVLIDQGVRLVSLASSIDAQALEIAIEETTLGTHTLRRADLFARHLDGEGDGDVDGDGIWQIDFQLGGEFPATGTAAFAVDGAKVALVSGDAQLPTSAGIKNALGTPTDWAAIKYLSFDANIPLRVQYLGQQQWRASQADRSATFDLDRQIIRWETPRLSVADLLSQSSDAPVRALASTLRAAGRGVASLTMPHETEFTLAASINGEKVTLDGGVRTDDIRLESAGISSLGPFPGMRQAAVVVKPAAATNGITSDADLGFEAQGPGWTASGILGRTGSSISIDIETIDSQSVIGALASTSFADTMLLQNTWDFKARVGQVFGATRDDILAESLDLAGSFSGGRLTLTQATGTLIDGDAWEASGKIDVLESLFGELAFVLDSRNTRTLAYGPFDLALAPQPISGTAKINGASLSEIDANLSLAIEVKNMPVSVSVNTAKSVPRPWLDLATSTDGARFFALVKDVLNSKAFKMSGGLAFRRGQWRANGLQVIAEESSTGVDAEESGQGLTIQIDGTYSEHSESAGEASDGENRARLDGSASFDINLPPTNNAGGLDAENGSNGGPDSQELRNVTLVVADSVAAPTLRLLGTYFRE